MMNFIFFFPENDRISFLFLIFVEKERIWNV